MTETLAWPHYEMQSHELADWLDNEGAEAWWTADGERHLNRTVDFPCPPEELSEALRKMPNRTLEVFDPRPGATTDGASLGNGVQLADLADCDNRRRRQVYAFRWKGEGIEKVWLLRENEPLEKRGRKWPEGEALRPPICMPKYGIFCNTQLRVRHVAEQ